MKKGHFALMFLLVASLCFWNVFLEQQKYRNVKKEKERMEESLLYAVKTAAEDLTMVMEEEDAVKLFTFQKSFLKAWFVRLGISGVKEEQDKLKLHLPLLAFLTEEGGYFFYTEIKEKNGAWELEQKWSEKIPYEITGDTEQDKKVIKAYLEEQVSEIISNHNYIAEQYGIAYEFSVPYFLIREEATLSLPMMLVVFQGWPLNGSGTCLYENCIDAGAYIKELDNE